MSAEFEIVVVGSGPAGQKAAIQSAKLGRKVALIERHASVGGASVNTGTIPSKTIREAILYLTGLNQRSIYGQGYRLKDEISIDDIALRVRQVVERERNIIRDQLLRNHVALLGGTARLVDPHTLAVAAPDGSERRLTVGVHRARGRLRARASAGDRLQRLDGARQRRHRAAPAEAAEHDRDRRSGRDRRRVRVDVRGARRQGDDRRRAPRPARLLRPRDRRVAALPPARPERDVPLR